MTNFLYKVDVYTLFHMAEAQFNVNADKHGADFIDPNFGEGNALWSAENNIALNINFLCQHLPWEI